jgi:hypothetical protein
MIQNIQSPDSLRDISIDYQGHAWGMVFDTLNLEWGD